VEKSKYQKLIDFHQFSLNNLSATYVKAMPKTFKYASQMVGILGMRGVGKTTFLMQWASKHATNKSLYVSADDILFSNVTLIDLADEFVKNAGECLFIDEIHKYNNWSQELKNIYDRYSELQVVFSGSSILELADGSHDLSRRAIIYLMQGLSFREFLNVEVALTEKRAFPAFTLTEILNDTANCVKQVKLKCKHPLPYFNNYLKWGYYPIYLKQQTNYHQLVNQMINAVLETDILIYKKVSVSNIASLKKLLYILAVNVPYKPNISKLANNIGIERNTVLQYLSYLEKAQVISTISTKGKGNSIFAKPDKIYLENTTIMHSITPAPVNVGTERETFLLSSLKGGGYKVNYPTTGDFLVDEIYTLEVGGKNKTAEQIENINNAYLAIDDDFIGSNNRIPLWLFGFLY